MVRTKKPLEDRVRDREEGGFEVPHDLRVKLAEARLRNAKARHEMNVRRGRVWDAAPKPKHAYGA